MYPYLVFLHWSLFDASEIGAARPYEQPWVSSRMPRDPVCGMYVDEKKGLTAVIGGKTYYFCSEECRRTFLAPEAELKKMKRRVTLAISGVVVLAALRAAAFLALAAGATILTWAPIPQL